MNKIFLQRYEINYELKITHCVRRKALSDVPDVQGKR